MLSLESQNQKAGRWGREGTEQTTSISVSSFHPTAEPDQAYLHASETPFKDSCLEYLEQGEVLPQ